MSAEKPDPEPAFTPPGEAPRPVEGPTPGHGPAFILGLFLAILGGALFGWYWLGFETDVTAAEPAARRVTAVGDLARVAEKLGGMIAGGVFLLLGTMLMLHRPDRSPRPAAGHPPRVPNPEFEPPRPPESPSA